MNRLKFNDFEDFACVVSDMFDDMRRDNDLNDISIIAKYEEAKQIIKELLCIGYDLRDIEIHYEIYNNYDSEYIISLCNFDGVDEIFCEPMKKENGYLNDESIIIYVLDNCSSEVLKHLDSEYIYEVCIGEDDECDESKCVCCHEDEKPVGKFTYLANGKIVTKEEFSKKYEEFDKKYEEFDKKYEDFEKKYLHSIKDMFFDYPEFMDIINEWRKRCFLGK